MQILPVLIFSASLAAAPATRPVATEKKVLVPADILRKAARDADSLELITETFARDDAPGSSKTVLSVRGREEVRAFLALIETPPVPEGSWSHHMCVNATRIELRRGKKRVASFSFDHVSTLRPIQGKLWGSGDVFVTDASARSIAKWFADRGFREYSDEIAREDDERARRTAPAAPEAEAAAPSREP